MSAYFFKISKDSKLSFVKTKTTQVILKKIAGEVDGVKQNIAGSCGGDGSVPNVDWNDGKLKVDWWNPRNANSNLRSRPEVSA